MFQPTRLTRNAKRLFSLCWARYGLALLIWFPGPALFEILDHARAEKPFSSVLGETWLYRRSFATQFPLF